jgi:hypothetical protein
MGGAKAAPSASTPHPRVSTPTELQEAVAGSQNRQVGAVHTAPPLPSTVPAAVHTVKQGTLLRGRVGETQRTEHTHARTHKQAPPNTPSFPTPQPQLEPMLHVPSGMRKCTGIEDPAAALPPPAATGTMPGRDKSPRV